MPKTTTTLSCSDWEDSADMCFDTRSSATLTVKAPALNPSAQPLKSNVQFTSSRISNCSFLACLCQPSQPFPTWLARRSKPALKQADISLACCRPTALPGLKLLPSHRPSRPDSLSERTRSFSQRLVTWLRNQGAGPHTANKTLQLSLDSRDVPRVLVNGQPSAAVDQALSKDPTWLQEFRELALDRIDDLAGLASSATASMTLTIRPQSDTMSPETTWDA